MSINTKQLRKEIVELLNLLPDTELINVLEYTLAEAKRVEERVREINKDLRGE